MADKKTSELALLNDITGDEMIVVAYGGANYSVTLSSLKEYFNSENVSRTDFNTLETKVDDMNNAIIGITERVELLEKTGDGNTDIVPEPEESDAIDK